VTFEFLPLSKIIENYRKLSKITPEIIVIDKKICYRNIKTTLQEIQKFYLHLRETHHCQDSTPITTRQLESLMRLTEARAKLELREMATGDYKVEQLW
jgi:DNA replicative helicase MCM subunit Mcm2 (Cdc46/Mcm family)